MTRQTKHRWVTIPYCEIAGTRYQQCVMCGRVKQTNFERTTHGVMRYWVMYFYMKNPGFTQFAGECPEKHT